MNSAEDIDPTQPKKQKTYKQETAKVIWMITYSASSIDITHEHLHREKILCDECYTVTWRESKYTLIHLQQSKKTRLSTMNKAMKQLDEKFGIKGSCIVGYDTLMFNEKGEFEITNHPAFKHMADLLNKDIPFANWIEHGTSIHQYRKGLLWKHITHMEPKSKTHAQLVQQINKWAPIVKSVDTIKAENEMLRSMLITREMEPNDNQVANGKGSSHSIRSSLFHYRHDKQIRHLMKKTSSVEKKLNSSEPSPDGSGEIYAAWNPLMIGVQKLGFTHKDAETRVKALQTAGVLEPFRLTRHARVPNARLYEKAMHLFFRDVRIYKRKEFFVVSAEEIYTFFDIVEGKLSSHNDNEQWTLALKKAGL